MFHKFTMLTRLLALPLFLGLAACGGAPAATPTPSPVPIAEPAAPGTCGLDVAQSASDEEQITALLAAEGQFVVEQNIERLMALWSDEAQVVDAQNTADDTSDDQAWGDPIAVQHRYVRIVFPGAPAEANPANIEIALDGERAEVIATTQIGDEISPAGDRWQVRKVDGCWVIDSLTYNLETQ